MKYAVISDIHGNLPALHAVLQDAHKKGVQGFLFAGDYCISAPWASEVVETIRNLEHTWIVRGNEESYLLIPEGNDGQFEISRYGKRSLTEEQKEWLLHLPEKMEFRLENKTVYMTHNLEEVTGKLGCWPVMTYQTALHYGKQKVSREQLLCDIRKELTENEAFMEAQKTLPEGIYICGHNHLQWYLQTEKHLFINPGSCGIPLDCGEFGASYTLLTIEEKDVRVEECCIPMNVEELIEQVKSSSQYSAARVWSEMIFKEWRNVREHAMFFLKYAEEYAQSIGDERRPFVKETWEAAYEAWNRHVDFFSNK